MTTNEYISFLRAKGFKLPEDALGFIAFGQKYTEAPDEMVNIAIEATLKHQRHFDGSYFVALLERLQQEKIADKKSAQAYVRRLER
ncbi:DUF6123 family protein [Ectobacillus panaciterrae]|uniref:DUF6123 family protein n=1 Tax=Ectobacillus panaciterrae TaxID=363872 RepID=UPI0004158FC8|nr:DUF6123 family protein [Ectobacillus panaciterrae]